MYHSHPKTWPPCVGVGAVLTKTASTTIRHTGTRGSVIGVGGASPWITAAGSDPMLPYAASVLKPRVPGVFIQRVPAESVSNVLDPSAPQHIGGLGRLWFTLTSSLRSSRIDMRDNTTPVVLISIDCSPTPWRLFYTLFSVVVVRQSNKESHKYQNCPIVPNSLYEIACAELEAKSPASAATQPDHSPIALKPHHPCQAALGRFLPLNLTPYMPSPALQFHPPAPSTCCLACCPQRTDP